MSDTKSALRTSILARRRQRSVAERADADTARLEVLRAHLPEPPQRVAAYASVDGEPGTDPILAWLLAVGVEVLLPALGPGGIRAVPAWARHTGRLRPGPYGIAVPDADAALTPQPEPAVGLVLCPGLAGTLAGVRLGRGGGWYDRALAALDAPAWLLLHDDEVLDTVPVDPWDRPVDALVTPTRFLACVRSDDPEPG